MQNEDVCASLLARRNKQVKSKPIIPLSARREKQANLNYSVDKMGITKNIFRRQVRSGRKNKDKIKKICIHSQLYTEEVGWNIDFIGMV